ELLRQRESVLHVVAAWAEVVLDVRRFEHDFGALAGDRAAAPVGVEDARPKGALALADDAHALDAATLVVLDELEDRRRELALDLAALRVGGHRREERGGQRRVVHRRAAHARVVPPDGLAPGQP